MQKLVGVNIGIERLTGPFHTGEIIPQAVCTRYGLAVGAYSAWFVKALMLLCGIVAWPISKILDRVLGSEQDVRLSFSLLACSPTRVFWKIFCRQYSWPQLL